MCHRGHELVGIALEAAREDRRAQDVERHPVHLRLHVDHAPGPEPRPAGGERIRGETHRNREPGDDTRGENGRDRPPLDAPELAFHRQQPVAEAGREHPLLQGVLAVIGDVVDQYAADRGRMVDHRTDAEKPASSQNGALEMRLRPGLDRIAAERAEEGERPQLLAAWGRRRRHDALGGKRSVEDVECQGHAGTIVVSAARERGQSSAAFGGGVVLPIATLAPIVPFAASAISVPRH